MTHHLDKTSDSQSKEKKQLVTSGRKLLALLS
jgi:hypothetical protein